MFGHVEHARRRRYLHIRLGSQSRRLFNVRPILVREEGEGGRGRAGLFFSFLLSELSYLRRCCFKTKEELTNDILLGRRANH